ncbi:MAG TPA: type II toxin-antitoxin system prevent-host-death family antitoxin [Thermoanaerobaculia bacterium]|nr:type II toxin-antitoxin system prevent-host-death family antitoxin [Thermoanaerobaculia bacterium]
MPLTTISLKDAQARLAETVKRTEAGPVVLEDSGQPVAIVLSIEEYHRLSVVDSRERDRLAQEAYDQIFGPFDRGEFRELNDQDWQALMEGQRKAPHDPQSLALPPKGRDD